MLVKRKRINPYNEKQTGPDGKIYHWAPGKVSICELPDDFAAFLIADCPEDYEDYAEYVPAPPTAGEAKGKTLADYSDEEIEEELNRRGKCSRKRRGFVG